MLYRHLPKHQGYLTSKRYTWYTQGRAYINSENVVEQSLELDIPSKTVEQLKGMQVLEANERPVTLLLKLPEFLPSTNCFADATTIYSFLYACGL